MYKAMLESYIIYKWYYLWIKFILNFNIFSVIYKFHNPTYLCIQVPSRFRYPYFKEIHWFTLSTYASRLIGQDSTVEKYQVQPKSPSPVQQEKFVLSRSVFIITAQIIVFCFVFALIILWCLIRYSYYSRQNIIFSIKFIIL